MAAAAGEDGEREVLRRRVASVYAAHAPDKLGQVEDVVDRHVDAPNALMRALETKYGPEPDHPDKPQSRPAAQQAPRPSGSGAAAASSPERPTPSRSATVLAPASSSPSHGGSGSPSRGGGGGGGMGARSQSTGSFGGDDDDELSSLKKMVSDSGFLTEDHHRRWEEAWLGKIPFATVCKSQTEVLMENFGYKHSAASKVFAKWQKRYFVVIPPFVYYFEKEEMTAPCRGVIYLPRAEVTEIEVEGRLSIEIQSQVRRKPTGKSGHEDFGSFVIAFDSDRLQRTWLDALRKLSVITAKKVVTEKQKAQRERAQSMAAMRERQQAQQRPVAVAPSVAATDSPTAVAAGSPGGASSASATAAKQLPIKREELCSRIRRVASQRDPEQVMHAVLDFVEANVSDTLQLWRLMDTIEGVEAMRATDPTSAASFVSPGSNAANNAELLRAASIIVSSQRQRRAPGQEYPAIPTVESMVVPPTLSEGGSAAARGIGATSSATGAAAAAQQGDSAPCATDALPPNDTAGTMAPPPMAPASDPYAAQMIDQQRSEMEELRRGQVEMQQQFQQLAGMMQAQQRAMVDQQNQQLQQQQAMLDRQQAAAHMPSYAVSRTDPSGTGGAVDHHNAVGGGGGGGGNGMFVAHTDNSLMATPQHTDPLGAADVSPGHHHQADASYLSPGSTGASPSSSSSVQQRMERMKNRKKALDEMMRDLPH